MTINEIRAAYVAFIDSTVGPIPAWREFHRSHVGRLLAEIDLLEHAIRNLLAVINRDGGQRANEIGDLVAACRDAETTVMKEREQ